MIGVPAGSVAAGMAHRSEPALLVLHALRLKGFADSAVVAEASGLERAAADAVLADLEGRGLVTRRRGRLAGWSLTDRGRSEHARLAAADLEASGSRPAVRGAYEAFMQLNAELLAACTAWQLREVDRQQVPNDHTDPSYDGAVMARLRQVDDRVAPTCSDLAAALERFSHYGPRLRSARDRVEAGQGDWFTRPDIDSYHSVWFELHEDLLSTLGLERAREGEGLLSRSDQ